MRAIDTNVVIRFLIADDRRQAAAARAVIEAGDIFIPTTVLLESEWVLRSGYDIPPSQIAEGLRALAGLPGVTVGNPAAVAHALDGIENGMDFADALHLALSEGCTTFLTFDKKLRAATRRGASISVETPTI